jgi:hypothetical protein
MSDIDRVFARFQGKPTSSDSSTERLSIPRKGGSSGSRVVEVVHVRPTGPSSRKDQSRRADSGVRSATWDQGFPAKSAPPASVFDAPPAKEAPPPAAHVMPAWEPTPDEAEAAPPAPATEPAEIRRPRGRPKGQKTARRIADPFDAGDDAANCIRCGFLVEPARDLKGLMTCAKCG